MHMCAQAKNLARTQKLDKLSAMYGGSGGHTFEMGLHMHGTSRMPSRAKAGSAGTERPSAPIQPPPQSYHNHHHPVAASSAAARASSCHSQRVARNGSATAPTTVGSNPRRLAQSQSENRASCGALSDATSDANMLRIPAGLRPGETAASYTDLSGAVGGGIVDDGRFPTSGMVSPLPFESSLAPDFLALFASWDFDT